MPFYSDELIEEVRAGNDIVDVISGYVKLQKKGNRYFGLCPFHNEKTPSFSVGRNEQMYYCFGCGAGGNVFTFLREYENFSFVEAMEYLAERAGIALPKQEYSPQMKQEADKRQQLLEVNKTAATYYYSLLRSDRGQRAYSYFTNRGLSKETMQKFGLGYSDQFRDDLYRYLKKHGYSDELLRDSGLVSYDEQRGGYDKFWNRAMFPIMNVHNKVIGFGGRVLGDGEPKYLNSPETKIFDKSRNLYGLNFARMTKRPYLLLCEGYMDVIALHQAGFDNAVASLGTAFTSGQANLLKRYTKEVYITYDSDGAGVRAALRAIPILKEAGLHAKVVNMQPHKDPDEFITSMGKEAYEKRIEEAENGFLFEVRILENDYDLKDPDGKTGFYNEVARRLLGFTQEIERNNYIEAVCGKYPIGYEELKRLVLQKSNEDGLIAKKQPLKSGRNEKKKLEDGMKQSQKLLLTALVTDVRLFQKIKDIITPEDFTEELYCKVANLLFEQFETTGKVNPAQIISRFEEEEEQREVASLFHATIKNVDSDADKKKVLKETVVRVKQNSIQYRSRQLEPTDLKGLQALVVDKRKLEQLQIREEI